MEQLELRTPRLLLRPLDAAAVQARIAAEPDPEMAQARQEMLDGVLRDLEHWLWWTEWAMVLPETGEIIGSLDFKGPPKNGEAEIGYGIDPPYEGRGLTTEAADALCRWAFAQEPGLVWMAAETEADNAASQRILEKLGFVPYSQGVEGPRFRVGRNRQAEAERT